MATVKDLARPESLIDIPTAAKPTDKNTRISAAITPSDTADLPPYRMFTIGGAGTITFMKWDGTLVQYTAAVGQTIKLTAKRVMSTNTAATFIVGER